MTRLIPATRSITALVEKADAIATTADVETARRTWSELRAPTLGTQFEGYVERQLERYEAIRAEAARRALADLRARWDEEWRFDFETRKALAALDQYERDFSGLLSTELESLRRYFLGLEAGPAEFLWRRRVLVRQGDWHTDSGVSILAHKGVEKDESWLRFTARGQSEFLVTFEIPDVPKRCHLRINAAQAISGRLREGRLKICINDAVLFGGWRPWSYSWAVYEWPVANMLKTGRNTISLHLTHDSVNQVWLRELSLLGYRDRSAESKENSR